MSTLVNLASTSVKFWQSLARPELPAWAIGAHRAGGGSVHPTPHLTSPLEGGRDELGKGSCLRRNDGRGDAGYGA